MNGEQERVFAIASGIEVSQLKNFNSTILMASALILTGIVLVGLIVRSKNGNFTNVVQTITEAMLTGLFVGLILLIAY